MTEYLIADNEVQIPTEVENERYVKQNTEPLLANIGNIFDIWYASQSDCVTVNRNAGALIDKAIGPLVSKAVEMLSEQGVYSIDADLFVRKYLYGFDEEFYNTLDKMMDRINEIDGHLASEKRYRELRKASRGRVIGGGFGLGGALKGMATAGVMNATTGMAHSLGNAVGNMGSSMSASLNKDAVYKNAKGPLREAIINCGYYARNGIREALEQEANIKCKYITITESNQAKAILQNYMQGRIPEAQRKNQIIQALLLDPYNIKIYEIIWNDYGDKSGDLRKLSSYFECGLEQKIQAIASKYGEDIFNSSCGEYLNAFNKTKAAVLLESNIKESLKKMEQYCEKHNVAEVLIPKISLCRELIQIVDIENRTVNGVVYSTREVANKIKSDYLRFYKNCEGRDLTDDVQFNQLCEQSYISKEFNKIAKSLCEKERVKRTPEKIYDNIWDVFISSLDEATLSAIGVNVVSKFGIFGQHEETVRTITEMPADEIALFVIERSSNGKSGIMITNKFLRIYSKGLLSTENQMFDITKIRSLECIGNDKFVIEVDKEKNLNISFKIKNVSDEKQILFTNAFNEAIQIITNLYLPHRQNLYRILYSVETCTCGMKLLSNEKICPSCGKMLRDNEEQELSEQGMLTTRETKEVETSSEIQCCSNCGAELEDNAAFCDKCGMQLIQQSEPNVLSTPPESSNINVQSMGTLKQSKDLKNSGLGIASMICGIISLCTLGFYIMPEILGLVLGIIAVREKNTKHTFAIVGIVMSAIAFAITFAIIIILVGAS